MEQTVNWEKVYVDTLVRHTKDGGSIPLSIKFSDGKTYEIDQVLDRKRAAASKVGGTGIRYSIRIGAHHEAGAGCAGYLLLRGKLEQLLHSGACTGHRRQKDPAHPDRTAAQCRLPQV